MIPANAVLFLVGVVVAPPAVKAVKPVLKGVVKTAVGLAAELKKAAAEASENLQDLTAEATAEIIAKDLPVEAKASKSRASTHPAH